MPNDLPRPDPAAIDDFVALAGRRLWTARIAEIARRVAAGRRSGKAILQRHVIELTIERLRRPLDREPSDAERRIAHWAREAASLDPALNAKGRKKWAKVLREAMIDGHTLAPAFHVLRTAAMQRKRGFEVGFAGFEEDAPFDLLIAKHGTEAEVVCDAVSAEEGRFVHRGAWFRLADRIDPDLQTWLASHPGRYLLKMTLPQGLQGGLHQGAEDGDTLSALHERIRALLAERRRADQDEALVLRLDPLLLAGAQADELGLMSSLRREFGPEAHLSVTAGGGGVFVMAARAGRADEVAVAIRRRMATIAPSRLTGTRPGILAMLVEDTDRTEWRELRERLELEGEARQFLTFPEARSVVAVTCASRLELFGLPAPDAAPDGELRFRNPAHPAAKTAALASAVQSSV
ncbi:MAG: hypothetical protein JOZ58_21230 [Acetobacteraceae bacterium]|nr:hypothetical protein [Acetobacteraceae bacterium]